MLDKIWQLHLSPLYVDWLLIDSSMICMYREEEKERKKVRDFPGAEFKDVKLRWLWSYK